MSMAMGPGPTAHDLVRDEIQERKQLQARVYDLESRVAALERTIRVILGLPQSDPQGDPVLDVPVP